MSTLELGPIGLALNVSADRGHLDEAAELEDLGYSAIWIPGGQLDTLDRISEVVAATTSIPVASGIISPDVYSPDAVLTLYATLQSTAPDRFIAGLGGSQKPYSIGLLNGYLDVLDQADPALPVGRRILAALGPGKLALARDRFAGAITLLVTPAHTAQARGILGERARLVVDQMIVLDTDAARARETARQPLRFLASVPGFAANFARMGFSATDISGLSDRLVDEVVAWGDVETIVARVGEHRRAGADQVLLSVLNDDRQPGPIEVARQLAGRLLG